jgi:hypothetical protein
MMAYDPANPWTWPVRKKKKSFGGYLSVIIMGAISATLEWLLGDFNGRL